MARKKFFAIRWQNGQVEIIHDSWDNVEEIIKGVSNVTFKSFDILSDAKKWTEQKFISYRQFDDPLENDKLYMFVDGSYSDKHNAAGWGWVAVCNNNIIGEDCGIVTDKTLLSSRNIAGELNAAMEAAKYYLENLYPKYLNPIMVYDYSGIGNWALNYWGTTKKASYEYVFFMSKYVEYFNFEKINGHTGNVWNDYADELARKGYTKSG